MGKVKILNEFKGGSMARTFLVSKNDEKYVRKIVEKTNDGLGVEKLMRQWRWLFDFNKQEQYIFPDVSFFVTTKKGGYYDMEYIEKPSLRDLLLIPGTGAEPADFEDVFRIMLEFGSVIAEPQPDEVPENNSYIIEKHLNKMLERCSSIATYDFFKRDKIVINGVEYKNILPMVREIITDPELLEYLRPKTWFRSHGDFTFQNVLSDGMETVIIDPRGEGNDSIYYDISKIFQSCHGKYDLLFEGNYSMNYYDGEVPKVDYKIHQHEEKFNGVYEIMKELIPEYYDLDENWEMITKFYEASHFISMMPFRLKENGLIAIVCYSIGIKILNEFLEEWNNVKSRLKK